MDANLESIRNLKENLREHGIVFDKVSDTAERCVYALSDRSKDEASATVSYSQRVRILVSKSDGALLLEDPSDATLLAVAEALRQNPDDVSVQLSAGLLPPERTVVALAPMWSPETAGEAPSPKVPTAPIGSSP